MRRTLFQGVTCPFLIKADESKTGIRYFNALATILSKMPAQALKRSMRARGAVSGSKLTDGSDSGEELGDQTAQSGGLFMSQMHPLGHLGLVDRFKELAMQAFVD